MSQHSYPVWDNTITPEIAKKLRKGADTADWKRATWNVPFTPSDRNITPSDRNRPSFESLGETNGFIENKKTVVFKYKHLSQAPASSQQHASRCTPAQFHRIVAVKIGKKTGKSDDPYRIIRREISIMKHILNASITVEDLKPDHLLLMTSFYESKGPPIIVTNFMAKEVLALYLSDDLGLVMYGKTESQLTDLKLQLCLDIASAVAYLHQCEILHRDIKALNIFLDSGERAYLADFDCGWIRQEREESSNWTGSAGYSTPAEVTENFVKKVARKYGLDHVTCIQRYQSSIRNRGVRSWACDLYAMGLLFCTVWLGVSEHFRAWMSTCGWALAPSHYQDQLYDWIKSQFEDRHPDRENMANVIYHLMKIPVTTPENTIFDSSALDAWRDIRHISQSLNGSRMIGA